MLPRAHRLHLSADLRSVMRRGRRFVLPNAVLFVSPQPGELARFAVVTPKRVGNAAARHQVARRVRHSWQPLINETPDGFSMVVRAEPGAEGMTVGEWTEAERAALRKALRQ